MKKIVKILMLVISLFLLLSISGCGGATYVGVGVSYPGAWGYGPYSGPYGGYGGGWVGRPYY